MAIREYSGALAIFGMSKKMGVLDELRLRLPFPYYFLHPGRFLIPNNQSWFKFFYLEWVDLKNWEPAASKARIKELSLCPDIPREVISHSFNY
jgi:hypothetical protein